MTSAGTRRRLVPVLVPLVVIILLLLRRRMGKVYLIAVAFETTPLDFARILSMKVGGGGRYQIAAGPRAVPYAMAFEEGEHPILAVLSRLVRSNRAGRLKPLFPT